LTHEIGYQTKSFWRIDWETIWELSPHLLISHDMTKCTYTAPVLDLIGIAFGYNFVVHGQRSLIYGYENFSSWNPLIVRAMRNSFDVRREKNTKLPDIWHKGGHYRSINDIPQDLHRHHKGNRIDSRFLPMSPFFTDSQNAWGGLSNRLLHQPFLSFPLISSNSVPAKSKSDFILSPCWVRHRRCSSSDLSPPDKLDIVTAGER
jgi:hypothetical protein